MNEIDSYRDLVNQCRLPINRVDGGFNADGGDFKMSATRLSSKSCWLSYEDRSVEIDVDIYHGDACFFLSVKRGYLAPLLSHLRESRNPLAKRVLEHINTDFSKDDQYAALSRVPVIDSIDGAVALVRDQVKFKEIICSR
jgi:hypothetical protein